MSLSAGDLNRKVTIQTPNYTPDGAGGRSLTGWSDVATVYAQITPVSGGEAFKLGVQNQTQFYRVSLRFREDVTPGNRLMWGTIPLNIRTSADPDGFREELAIMAESGVADG